MKNKDKNKETIVKFAMDELKKTVESLKQGKTPMVSTELKKIFDMLNNANDVVEKEKLSEDILDEVVEKVANKINKEK
jgi:hypothetical protein